MKAAKLGFTITLLLFVGVTVGTLVAQELTSPAPQLSEIETSQESDIATRPNGAVSDGTVAEAAPSSSSPPTDLAEEGETTEVETGALESATSLACVVEAIYFHNTHRCVTCLRIESEAKRVVEAEFAAELARGTLRWSAVNMEEHPEVVEQYDLVQPTLILVRHVNGEAGQWIALGDTWALVRYAARFSMYIVDSFRVFLEGCS